MDDGLGDSHRRVIGSGMLMVDSAAVRILDLLVDRNAPAATDLSGRFRLGFMFELEASILKNR